MNVNVRNIEELDCKGSQIKIYIPISQKEEPELVITKSKANEIGNTALSKIWNMNCKGFCILKIIRIINGITQAEMAKSLCMPISTYRHKENRDNGSDFMTNEAEAICKRFKMSFDILFRNIHIIEIA